MLAELPPEIGLVFDPANLGAVGMSTDEILDLYGKVSDRIVYLHLKDFRQVSTEALQPCACGEGQLEWTALAGAFSGFAGTGFIEYELPADIEAGTRRSIEALKAAEHGYIGTRSSATDLAV
jgi:sugar phosphate isomerase/epimerase